MSRGTAIGERTHPLHRFAGRVHEVLDDLGHPVLWSLTETEVTETITELHSVVGRVQAHLLGLVGHADGTDLASSTGHVNTAALVRSLTTVSGPVAHRAVKTARGLDAHPLTRDALRAGALDVDQAQVILAAVKGLPDSIGSEDRDRAERHLLGLATVHDAWELRRLGAHLIDVIDPDGADERLAKQLEKQEREQARKTFLSMWRNDQGGVDGKFRLTGLTGAMLERLLHAHTNPDRPDPIATHDPAGAKRPTSERLGEAFEALIQRYPLDKVPQLRGRNATVVVTMTIESLLGGLAPAVLDTGDLISAAQARCLAADAGIIPAVLGSDGVVLDHGTQVRCFDGNQRLAMSIEQGSKCAVEGCDRPAWWCDAAHLIAWVQGGPTDKANGALICPRHHQLADSSRFRLQRTKPGRVRLVRRQ